MSASIPPAEISPIVSVTNTRNEGTDQLIAPAVVPAATITVTGNNGGDATAPAPVITLLGSTATSPHSVFVHALDSTLGAGNVLNARYQWDFGDPGSENNTLVGWNAAHTYDQPGTYTITLTLTNELGKTRVLSTTVTESPSNYQTSIYVDSVNGKDSNNGNSPSSAVKTVDAAMKLMGSNTQLLFHAGDTFSLDIGMAMPFQNILVASYGTGAEPVMMRGPGVGTSSIVLFDNSQNVVVQNLTFDSVWGPVGVVADVIPANGVLVAGENVTIRNCTFLNLDDGINEAGNPQGVIVSDCNAPLATGLRGCLIWGQGTDQVFLDNSDANSTRQHDMRTVDTIRQLISGNHFTNLDRRSLGDAGDYSKGTIDVHRGSYAYVSDNWTYDGELRVGPRFGPTADPGDTTQWVVVEGNHVSEYPLTIYPAAYHVMVRNNILTDASGPIISVEPRNTAGDNIQDITFANNTGVTTGVAGQFIQIGNGGTPGSITLLDNLWLAPQVITGEHMNAAIFIEDSTPKVLGLSQGNVWQMPYAFNKYAAGGINYVNPSWLPPQGYYTPAAWNALPFVKNDIFSATPVASDFTPLATSAAATAGVQDPGVFVDAYGRPRPASGPISAGAVQAGAGSATGTGSGTGTGAGTGSGAGAGSGSSSTGAGTSSGTGSSSGSGSGTGTGSGKTTGTQPGTGSGSGSSTGTGAATGSGSGTGATGSGSTTGSGKSAGTGTGSGSATGSSTGNTAGAGQTSGSGTANTGTGSDNGSATGTGSGTASTGSASGTGTSSTGAGSASQTPPPATPPATTPPSSTATDPGAALTAMADQVSADRAAFSAAMRQRHSTLVQLMATKRADAAALRGTKRQLMLARRKRAPQISQGDSAELAKRIAQLKKTLQADNKAIANARRTDFSGIHAAEHKLILDTRAMRNAKRKEGH